MAATVIRTTTGYDFTPVPNTTKVPYPRAAIYGANVSSDPTGQMDGAQLAIIPWSDIHRSGPLSHERHQAAVTGGHCRARC